MKRDLFTIVFWALIGLIGTAMAIILTLAVVALVTLSLEDGRASLTWEGVE